MPFSEQDFGEPSTSFTEVDFESPRPRPGVLAQIGQSLKPSNIFNNLVAPAATGVYNALGEGFINTPAMYYKLATGQPIEERILGVDEPQSTLPFKPVRQGVPITDIRIPDADVNPVSGAMQELANGLMTPENLMTLPAGGGASLLAKGTRAMFAGQAAEGLVQGAQEVVRPDATPYERVKGGIHGAASAAMGYGLGRSLEPKVGGFTAADFGEKSQVPMPEAQHGGMAGGMLKAVQRNQEAGGVDPSILKPETSVADVAKVQAKEKELRGDFALTGTRFLLDPKESGFGDSNKPVDAQHVWNRLANKLKQVAPDELKIYEELEIDKNVVALGKVSPQRVAEVLAERGPRVETKVLKSGESLNDPIAKGYAELRHSFYDNLDADLRLDLDDVVSGDKSIKDWAEFHRESLNEAEIDSASDYVDAAKEMRKRDLAGTQRFDPDVYRKIAPKDADQTVVMVRVPIPPRATTMQGLVDAAKRGPTDVLNDSAGHWGSEGKNLLGWARGQWETTKEGKKVFHIFEVQSDWSQSRRDAEPMERHQAQLGRRPRNEPPGHPLLDHYQRLTLKAAIDHAKKEGADAVAISDAETAMMVEGHDLAMEMRTEDAATIREIYRKRNAGEITAQEAEKQVAALEPDEPIQSSGMRLNYDRILPKIVEELTGSKGEKVNFGENQRAYEDRGGKLSLRERLIFEDSPGVPKTTATALMYPIDKVPSKAASLFEKDRPATRETKLYGGIPFFDPDFYKGVGDKVQQAWDMASTKTVPATMRADATTGNALVRYAIDRTDISKQTLLKNLVKNGLAVPAKSGLKSLGGKEVEKVTFTRRGRAPKTMLVRADIAPEVLQAIGGHSKLVKGALGGVFDTITSLQTKLGVDFVWHTGNMLAAVNGSTRSTLLKNVDLLGSREVNTLWRIGKNLYAQAIDSPEFKRELAQLTKVGAGRSNESHLGLFGKEPMSGKLLKFIDKAGRVTLNQMYNELVEAKLVQKTEHGRREFVNQMGQYNSALMSRMQQILRELGLSPFVVAGRTFNRLAVQRLLLSPSVKAANPVAWAQMRLYNLVGLTTSLLVTPILANYLISGTPTGRKGVPPGAIDTGKSGPDDEPVYIDMAQMHLTRRGARLTGLSALQKGLEKGETPKQILGHAAKDVISGVSHPYTGPGVSSIFGFASSLKETPKRIGQHGVQFAKDVNPTISAAFKGAEEGGKKGAFKELTKTLGGAFGVKYGPKPSFEDRKNKVAEAKYGTNFASLNLQKKIKVQNKVNEGQPIRSDKQRESASIYQVHSEFDRLREIKAGLSKSSREFLEQHKLEVPNIETSIRKSGTTIPMEKDQAKSLIDLTTKYYEEGVQKLMQSTSFQNANEKSKERQFDAYMHRAKNKARRDLKMPMLR